MAVACKVMMIWFYDRLRWREPRSRQKCGTIDAGHFTNRSRGANAFFAFFDDVVERNTCHRSVALAVSLDTVRSQCDITPHTDEI